MIRRMRDIKVIFFDVGYTLVNEDAVWRRRCQEQAETEEAKRLGLSAGDIFRAIEEASQARMPQFRTVIDRFRFKETAPYRHDLETLYEDAPPALAYLSGKYALGVIANQTDGLKERLNAFGILPYFTHIVSSWDVQVMKPDARIFEYAIRQAACPAGNAVMIGDRLDNDIIPAKAAGMKTVWIRRGFGRLQEPLTAEETPDCCIGSLTELLKIF